MLFYSNIFTFVTFSFLALQTKCQNAPLHPVFTHVLLPEQRHYQLPLTKIFLSLQMKASACQNKKIICIFLVQTQSSTEFIQISDMFCVCPERMYSSVHSGTLLVQKLLIMTHNGTVWHRDALQCIGQRVFHQGLSQCERTWLHSVDAWPRMLPLGWLYLWTDR